MSAVGVITGSLVALIITGLIRLSFGTTGGKWIFGFDLEFERCGCKHFNFFLGLWIVRFDFGQCRTGE